MNVENPQEQAVEEREIGNWVIQEKIGEGGMGEVYLAHHRTLGIPAALKILSPTWSRDPRFRERFLREARSQAQLQHPSIAQVMDFLETGQDLCIVIEHLSGGTLADRLERETGPVAPATALSWACPVLFALDYAHRHGVIHRDIKPSNLMFDGEGHIQLVDFGVAKVLDGPHLTTDSSILGTPHYMSPEQIRRPLEVDHRTDVYSMGVVLYEMLAGKRPFEGDSHFDVESAHVNTSPPPLRQHNPAIPEEVETLVLRALAKEPDRRFSGCGEFARALEAINRPRPSAGPEEPGPGSRTTSRRWKVAFACALGAGLVVLALLGLEVREAARYSSSARELGTENASLREDLQKTRDEAAGLKQQFDSANQHLVRREAVRQAKTWPLHVSERFLTASSIWGQGDYSTPSGSGNQHFFTGGYWWNAKSSVASWWVSDRGFSVPSPSFLLTGEAKSVMNPPDTYWFLAFRKTGTNFYSFRIDSANYSIWKEGTDTKELRPWTQSSLIRRGESNRLSVLARDSSMIFLINDEVVDEIEDSSFPSGGVDIGVGFRSPGKTADFAFSLLEVRRAPS